MIKKTPRPYQVEALSRWKARRARGLGLFHEQRVGKTLPALMCVDHEKLPRLLVVTTKKGIKVWEKEIYESFDPLDWPNQEGPEIILINYSQLINKSRYRKLRKWVQDQPCFMIVDEAHHIKKRSSRWSKRCRGLGKVAECRLALTGTPIAQGIQDAWAIFDYIDPKIFGPWLITRKVPRANNRPLLIPIGGFQHDYLIMDSFWKSKVVGTQNEEQFYEIYHRHSVRKTLAEVKRDAGEKPLRIRRQYIKGKLSRAERARYRELEEDMETLVNGKRVSARQVIVQSIKLQQIAGGFLVDQHRQVHSIGNSKLRLLLMNVPEARLKKMRPVVVCRYLHEIDAIENTLVFLGYRVKRVQGGVEFDPNKKITEDAIILQIQSGVAIDLAVADTLIFYSWNFSMIDFEQVKFRVLQYNSTKISYIYLTMENTVDELILESVRTKKRFADVVCDHYRRRRK